MSLSKFSLESYIDNLNTLITEKSSETSLKDYINFLNKFNIKLDEYRNLLKKFSSSSERSTENFRAEQRGNFYDMFQELF
jgi:flagellar biosynthesis chaperone FliJ